MENENVKRFTPVLFPASLEGRLLPNRAIYMRITVEYKYEIRGGSRIFLRRGYTTKKWRN